MTSTIDNQATILDEVLRRIKSMEKDIKEVLQREKNIENDVSMVNSKLYRIGNLTTMNQRWNDGF